MLSSSPPNQAESSPALECHASLSLRLRTGLRCLSLTDFWLPKGEEKESERQGGRQRRRDSNLNCFPPSFHSSFSPPSFPPSVLPRFHLFFLSFLFFLHFHSFILCFLFSSVFLPSLLQKCLKIMCILSSGSEWDTIRSNSSMQRLAYSQLADTENCSLAFPAYYLGRNPYRQWWMAPAPAPAS